MSKTMKNMFYENLTFEKMLKAHERSIKNKKNKRDVLKFNMDLETNLWNIINKLKNEKYSIGKYKTFTVYEPKKRVIKSLPYVDRVIQQWYIYEFIKPFFVKRFISNTCACIEKRGTHYAVDKAQKYMRIMKRKNEKYYILKCDIKNFFYSIDKDILFNILKKAITDKKILHLTEIFIFDSEDTGIPIGNYTSQYFANIYLDILDHFIKEKLKVKYYVRYMDDFILLVNSKNDAKRFKKIIEEFLNKNLNLELNNKSNYYPNKSGINFCGYIIYETHRLLRKRAKIQMKKRINLWNKLNSFNKLNENKMILEWNSFLAHFKHANSYNFILKMYNKIDRKDLISLNVLK